MTASLRIGVVGAGVMGTQHARLISQSSRAVLAAVVDQNADRARAVASIHTAAAATTADWRRWDAAIVATPTSSHLELALELIQAGKPVLVEKPLADTLGESLQIIALAETAGVPIMCGFVERFNPVIVALPELLDGPPLHIVAIRHSPRAERVATSVIYDLLIHDLDIVARVCAAEPVAIGAAGWRSPESGLHEIVDACIRFDDGIATCSADRWGQRKVRALSVSTSSQLIELDLLRQDVTVYRHVRHEVGSDVYRAETVVDIPFVRHAGEPLALQLEHFVDLVGGVGDIGAERASLARPHELAAAVAAKLEQS